MVSEIHLKVDLAISLEAKIYSQNLFKFLMLYVCSSKTYSDITISVIYTKIKSLVLHK